MSENSFTANFSWGSSTESPAQISERLLRSVEVLREIDPAFQSWWFTDLVAMAHVPMEQAHHKIAALVEQGVQTGDDEEPEPAGGYYALIVNNPEPTPKSVQLRVRAGARHEKSFFGNYVVFTSEYGQTPDPAIITYSIYKSVMMAMIGVWNATSSAAFCSDLNEIRQESGRLFAPGWMTYLAPPLLARITPPTGVLCEPTPDGGLLMIAAEETFDPTNPRHMAAAWRISDALAPLTQKEFLF
jgi:hypothetical protein